ncbi:MAG: AAA family ATPase [Thermoplasmata archaeon]|nr:AAA family ATPase [Thermoplasmata archaeon]
MAPPAPPVDHRPLTERLRPSKLSEMVGNAAALAALRSWAAAWSGGTIPARRAAVLAGPPGVGKTTAALALAQEMGWSVVEMNASDARNQTAIEQVAGRASLTETLGTTGVYRSSKEGGRSLILLDEADCLTGRAIESSTPRATPLTLRQFLRGRYGTVEALANAWGLGKAGHPRGFESWENVPATAGRAAWARLPSALSDLNEWRGAAKPKDLTDRGGLGAIARLVRETRQPLVLTVNDERTLTRYSPVFRNSVARVHFGPVPDALLRGLLRRIILREELTISASALDAIVHRCRGDVRAALNDLEAVAPLPPDLVQGSVLGGRDSVAELEGFTEEVFGHPMVYRNVEIRNRLDATPDDLFPWIEENLPRFAVDAAHRYRGFELLGRAELFLARARRQRVWGLWSYASEMMTGGVSLAASEGASPRSARAFFPSFLGDMGRTRQLRAQRTALSQRTGRRFHVSRRKANELFFPWMEGLLRGARRDPKEVAAARRVLRELQMTAEDVAILLGVEPESAQVAEWLGTPEMMVEEEVTSEPTPPALPPSAEPGKKRQRSLGEF